MAKDDGKSQGDQNNKFDINNIKPVPQDLWAGVNAGADASSDPQQYTEQELNGKVLLALAQKEVDKQKKKQQNGNEQEL